MHGVAAFGTCGCRMAAETAAFVKSLRNFLRGPSDDATLRDELYELVEARLISREQAARSRLRSRCVHWPASTRPHLHATHLYLDIISASIPFHMQADATMAASNRPMFCLSAMSATLRKVRAIANGVFSASTPHVLPTCNACACACAVHAHGRRISTHSTLRASTHRSQCSST